MDCDLSQREMIPFYFGEIDNDVRQRVEEHLVVCPTCLRAFFVLKGAVETSEARPSEKAKARLREAVAQKVVSKGRATWLWWQRPLAVAVAVAAVVLANAMVTVMSGGPVRAPNGWSKSATSPMP